MLNLNRGACRGFTFVELVLVLTIAGVLAAVMGPRMVDRTAFQTHGGAAEIRTALRYAQKLALAKNREVCVTTSPTGLALRFENPVVTGVTACNQVVVRLGDTPPATYTVTLPAGINLTSVPANFSFDSQGRPNPNAIVSLTVGTVGGSAPVTVEPDTGYVH